MNICSRPQFVNASLLDRNISLYCVLSYGAEPFLHLGISVRCRLILLIIYLFNLVFEMRSSIYLSTSLVGSLVRARLKPYFPLVEPGALRSFLVNRRVQCTYSHLCLFHSFDTLIHSIIHLFSVFSICMCYQ